MQRLCGPAPGNSRRLRRLSLYRSARIWGIPFAGSPNGYKFVDAFSHPDICVGRAVSPDDTRDHDGNHGLPGKMAGVGVGLLALVHGVGLAPQPREGFSFQSCEVT